MCFPAGSSGGEIFIFGGGRATTVGLINDAVSVGEIKVIYVLTSQT